MKKIYLLLVPILMIIFSTKVYAATSSFKNNPINYQTNINFDLKQMGIARDYYIEVDDEKYNRSDIIGVWEYYYDDGRIDLFIYVYNPYIGESEYNKRMLLNENDNLYDSYLINDKKEEIKIENNNMKFLSHDGQIIKYVCQNPIKDLKVGTYKKRTYKLRTYNSVVDYFNATFTNYSQDESIDVSFEFNGYMFIFEKEAFRIYADLSQFDVSWKDRWKNTWNNLIHPYADQYVFTPELLSFNFNIPKGYDLKDINSIDFHYKLIEKEYKKESLSGAIISNNVETEKRLMLRKDYNNKNEIEYDKSYTKNDYIYVKGEYLDNKIEFNELKRIDNNKNRYNEKKLDQEYIKINLNNYYQYEWSLIFDATTEVFLEEKNPDSGSAYISTSNYTWISHDAGDMSITRMNYTDTNGKAHNVIVNQGSIVDITTPLPYNPIRPQGFWEWLWEKINEFYVWLFGVVGANNFIKKAITVAASILLIPVVLWLIPVLIKLILQLAKIVTLLIKSIFNSIFRRKK